jgi:excisionase family DNA binding protein
MEETQKKPILRSGHCLLNILEASEYTGYSKKYLYKLTCEKRIPHYKPQNGRVFFKREDLDAFMMRGRVAADYEVAAKADEWILGGLNERR